MSYSNPNAKYKTTDLLGMIADRWKNKDRPEMTAFRDEMKAWRAGGRVGDRPMRPDFSGAPPVAPPPATGQSPGLASPLDLRRLIALRFGRRTA